MVSISGWKSHILILCYLPVLGWWSGISTLLQFISLWVLQRSCTFSVISEPVCRKLPQLFLLSYPWYILQSDIYCLTLWYSKLFYKWYFMGNCNKLIMSNSTSCPIVCTTCSGHMWTCEGHKHNIMYFKIESNISTKGVQYGTAPQKVSQMCGNTFHWLMMSEE